MPAGMPRVALRFGLRLLGRFMQAAGDRVHVPGASLELLPGADLPNDLRWSSGTPHVSDAFARAAAAIGQGATRTMSESVRSLVLQWLDDWTGHRPGLTASWADDAVICLSGADRPAARLALLTAMSSDKVSDAVVDDFRQSCPDDQSLIELTSWASLAAARRIGGWLPARHALD